MSFAGPEGQVSEPRDNTERATLRETLRAATAGEHAVLDRELAHFDLSRRSDLARFLQIHLAARRGIEAWLAQNCPSGWEPPAQTGLIAADLEAMQVPADRSTVEPFARGAACDWIGPAYVIAGSHLGNRLLLAQAGLALPDNARRFLSGTEMQDYWRRMRVMLADPPGPDGGAASVRGAHAAFAHFRRSVERTMDAPLTPA